MPPKENPNKVILITGSSSGFGLLTAARLAHLGHRVIATMRDVNKQKELQEEITKRGGRVDVQRLDVTDKNSIDRVCEYIKNKYGHLDILVNNAGYFMGGAFEALTEKEFRDQFETNFFGVLAVTKAMIPLMRNRPGAKIINLSSVSGFSSSPCFSAYSASKWAIEGFSESLYYELKPFGISVHLVRPGAYPTPIFFTNSRVTSNFDDKSSPYYDVHQYLKGMVDQHMKKNKRNPETVAALIEKIIIKEGMPFRNIPDFQSKIQYLLKRILPFEIYSKLIERVFLGKG